MNKSIDNLKESCVKSIIIIPARGGSKGIPRKNLRPLGGYPLIYYSIKASLAVNFDVRVVVTTDDDEIALFANRFGADVHKRSSDLSDDKTTLDPVIANAVAESEVKYNEKYGIILTIQPTSPLLSPNDMQYVYEKLINGNYDTVLTVVDDRHLCWTVRNGISVPLYEHRVNRQYLPTSFKETGGIIACTRKQLSDGTRIGARVGVAEVPYERSFDIDNFADLYVCEAMLMRKKVIFTVVGYPEVGLGHAFRAVMLAHELVQYDISFVCEKKSALAIDFIRLNNYPVIVAEDGTLAETVISAHPDLIINDILDTSLEYMTKIKDSLIKTVNFEDMGAGHELADLVINALYPHQIPLKRVLVGPKYFCLRDEFLYIDKTQPRDSVKKVLITFGGVDEGNITQKVFNEIAEICINYNVELEIIVGPGYPHFEVLSEAVNVKDNLVCNLTKHTKRISEHMNSADIAITSGGRTVLELAALKIPSIVICQNDRETTHTFASSEFGVINLGHREHLEVGKIAKTFEKVLSDSILRKYMIEKMNNLDLTKGKSRVISKINKLVKT